MSTEKEVKAAIAEILEDEKSYATSLNYAVGYCAEALRMTGHDLKVQILYILNNISHWRHPKAKEIRKMLKSFTG
jgi:hypothetical protein